jgi:membrane protein implicated in regulation of membrane protease activity
MPVYYSLILAAILIIIEIFTAGFFIACFAIGAIFAGAAKYLFDISMLGQTLVFVIVSVTLIPLTRILARRFGDDDTPQAGAV